MRAISSLLSILKLGFFILLFGFGLCLAKIANKARLPGIRIRKKSLQTGILFYHHPVCKREVILVGTTHIGETPYFAQLKQIIDQFTKQGYKILFEGVGKPTEEETSKFTPPEQEIWRMLESMLKILHVLASMLKLEYQGKDWSKIGWINTDIPIYELVTKLADYPSKNLVRSVSDTKLWKEIEEGKHQALLTWLLNIILSNIVGISIVVRYIFRFKSSLPEHIIVDERNVIALQSIESYGIDSNVVSIWGAEHLRGLARGLTQRGYQHRKTLWLEAYTARSFGIRKLWKSFMEEMEEAEETDRQ